MTDVRSQDAPTMEQKARRGPNAVGDFIWYELMTTDAEGAKAFYDSVVGWTIGEGSPEFSGYRMINAPGGGHSGGVLPITAEMQQHGARPMWLGYLNVDDVDEKVREIEAAGGKTWMAATDIPNVGRIALVTDPQAAPFYVMKPIPPADNPDAASDVFSEKPGHCGWNELQTLDVEAARSFYADQFGWRTDEFMSMGEMGEYRFIDHHGVRLGAMFDARNGLPPHFRFYFRVPSVSAAKERAEQIGGTIHIGPHEVPTGEWIVIGSDPQGAEFALVGGK